MAIAIPVLWTAGAQAGALEIWGPSDLVLLEGFEVAVAARGPGGELASPAEAQVFAEGAHLGPGLASPMLRTFTVVPNPGAARVRIRASLGAAKAEAEFRLGPPAAKVELTLVPERPVKGRDAFAELTIRVRRGDGKLDDDSAPPVVRANVGSCNPPERIGPGIFRARYELPKTSYPEVAVIVAFSAWPHPASIHGATGSLLVPLSTAIELPGRTEPNATMSIEVAGVRFGPVEADGAGAFRIPVVVPPGHRFGNGIAIDRARNRRATKIDLMLPPTDQLACVASPERLPAVKGARARVLCAATDVYGRRVVDARVGLSASLGSTAGPRSLEGGVLEWVYAAPDANQTGHDELRASWKVGSTASTENLSIELVQGPAVKVEIEKIDSIVHRGSIGRIGLQARDELGRPRAGADVQYRVDNGPWRPARTEGGGHYGVAWTVPATGKAPEASLEVTALGPMGTEPARLLTWAEGGDVWLGVTDLAGLPVAGQLLKVDGAEVRTGVDGRVRLGALREGRREIVHDRWPGLRLTAFVLPDGQGVFPALGAIHEAELERKVALAPPTPVNVRFEVSGRQVTYWVENPAGEVLKARRVSIAQTPGPVAKESLLTGRGTLTVEGPGPVTVSVADLETGVTGVVEVGL